MRVEKNGVLSRWPLVELSAYESVLLGELQVLYLQNTEITTTELHDGSFGIQRHTYILWLTTIFWGVKDEFYKIKLGSPICWRDPLPSKGDRGVAGGDEHRLTFVTIFS